MANIILKTNSSSYGTVTPATTFYLGEQKRRKIEAIPKSGYKFSHWSKNGNWARLEYEDGGIDEQTLYTAEVYVRSLTASTEQNITFTANFVAKSYSISSYTNNNSYGSAPGLSHTNAVAGTTITITPKPLTGYYLSSIKVSYANAPATTVPVTNNTFTMPAMNVNVYATYAAKPSLTAPTPKSLNASYAFNTNISYGWNTISGAKGYKVYVKGNDGNEWYQGGDASTESGATLITGNSFTDKFGYQRIGYQYQFKVKAYSNNSSSTDSAWGAFSSLYTICGKIYAYDLNGNVLTSYNGALATSWNASSMNYKPSGYGTVTWHINSKTGDAITSFTAADFRKSTYQGVLKVYATANPTKYTLTFNAGAGSCSPTTASVTAGSVYNLSNVTVTPPQGKSFNGWKVNSTTLSPTSNYKPTANTTLTAIYIDNYNIDYNLNAPTKVGKSEKFIPSPTSIPSATITAGTAYTIYSTTPIMEGHVFSCWKDSSGATYPVGGTYNKSSGTTLTAQWTANTYAPKKGTPEPASAPQYPSSFGSWKFNTGITMPAVPSHDEDKWQPQSPFWKVTIGSTSVLVAANGTYNFNVAATPTVTPLWKQVTYWRGGQLWIYVPEEGGFFD